MIELNLLERKVKVKLPVIAGIDLNYVNIPLVIVAILITGASSYYYTSYYEEIIAKEESVGAGIKEQTSKIDAEIKSKEAKKRELEAYIEQVQKARVRSLQIDEIIKTRTNPKKILEVIARTIPDEVTFDTLEITANDDISINGESSDPRSIGEFIAAVNDTPYFGGSITPSSQNSVQVDNGSGVFTKVDNFSLRGKIKNYDMRSN